MDSKVLVMDSSYVRRAVVGARPGKAIVLRDEAGLLAGGITPERARAFAQWAAERTPTGSNSRGSAAYRAHLVKVLVRRAAEEAGGNAL